MLFLRALQVPSGKEVSHNLTIRNINLLCRAPKRECREFPYSVCPTSVYRSLKWEGVPWHQHPFDFISGLSSGEPADLLPLQDAEDRIARHDADDAAAGDDGDLLHADVAHAVEQGKRRLFGCRPLKLALGKHHSLHGSHVPIVLGYAGKRLCGHQTYELVARKYQVRSAACAQHFARVVFQ